MSVDAARFVGNIPHHYDNGLGPVLFHTFGDDIARRVAATGATSVLELAAGTGIVSRKLRDILPSGASLLATDLNQPMLDISAGKFEPHENIDFQTVDATDLPFSDDSYDAIVCQFGVMFFPDKDQSYREARRVLRDGGHYIFNVWGGWEVNPFARFVHDTVAAFFEGNPPVFYQTPFGYDDIEAITASLEAAGFSDIKADRLNHHAKVEDLPAFSTALIHGNPIADEIKNLGGDPDAAVVAMKKALIEAYGESPNMPLEAIVITAK